MLQTHSSRSTRHLLLLLAALISAVMSLCLCGCLGFSKRVDVAATVDSNEIYESDVTSYIEGFRESNEQYETDSGWSQYLSSIGQTADSFRTYVITNVFIPKEVIRIECAKRKISVSDDELDYVIEQEKAYYDEKGQDAWASMLDSYGYDEASWRSNEEDRLLEERLLESVVGDYQANDAQVQAYISENSTAYNGKHSYYAMFASEEAATTARSSIFSGDNTDVTTIDLTTFQSSVTAANAGWNSLEGSTGSLSGTYQTVLNDLNVGEVSAPFQDSDNWLLVFCDQVSES